MMQETSRGVSLCVNTRWLALPLSARGLLDELTKYVDEENVVALCLDADADAHEVGGEIARLLCAHRGELARVRRDTKALIDRGLIESELDGVRICIDVAPAERVAQSDSLSLKTSAVRMRPLRDLEREQASLGAAQSPSHVTPAAVTSDARSDAGDASPVTRALSLKAEINLNSPQENPPKRRGRRRERGQPIPADLQLTDERRRLATQAGLDADIAWRGFTTHFRKTGQVRPDWDLEWFAWIERQERWKREARGAVVKKGPIVQAVDLNAPWFPKVESAS